MKVLRQTRGTVVWNSDDDVLLSLKNRLRFSNDLGRSFLYDIPLPMTPRTRLQNWSKMGCRLFRTGIRQVIEIEYHVFLLLIGRQIFLLRLKEREIFPVGELPGFPPLRMAWDGQKLVFGEYFGNKERTIVPLWFSSDLGANWEQCFEFNDIRHVHGVYFDEFDECFWITTGDYENEAAIWRMGSGLEGPEPVFRGDQKSRAIDILVYGDRLVYGTDTQLTQNYIIEVDKNSMIRRTLCEVGGSVFFCRDINGQVFATTAVEPSDFNHNKFAEVWQGLPTEEFSRWTKIASFKKDLWHIGFFQFGQVKIPAGKGNTQGLWITPVATDYDQESLLLDVRQ